MSATKVVTGKVRFSYLNVFQPRAAQPGQEPKYSVCLLIRKDDEATLKKVKAGIQAAAEAGKAQWGGKVPAGLKLPLRDGDAERDSAEYKGHWFINCNSKQKPGVVDSALNPILDASEIVSGDYGRASINFFPYANSGNRGVGAGLQNLQKLADGEPLSGRSRAEDDFTEASEDFLN